MQMVMDGLRLLVLVQVLVLVVARLVWYGRL